MRIAYIYDAVYPFVKGGVERRIYEVGKRLAKKHEVHWFSLDWNGELEEMQLRKVGRWNHLYSGNRRSIGEAIYFAKKLLLKFEGNYDIIDCQEFPYLPCFSAKVHSVLRRTPLIVTWHEVWNEYWHEYLGKLGRVGQKVEILASRLSSYNISVSRLTQKGLLELGVYSTVIPNGIDFNEIRAVPPSKEKYDIIFAGRLIKEKNVELLIRAVKLLKAEMPDVRVLIIGDGPQRERLEKLVREFGLTENVYFRGFLDEHEKLISYVKSSKVFVLPSIREGFGITALEANASGIPVVTVISPLNAVKDLVIPGYNGFLAFSTPNSLANSILEGLLYYKKLKKNCINNAKGYDWDNIARLTENFYERVINGG
ncbi:MAG: Glycosyltransferase, family 1 [Thermococcales archaeon 44_46]|jgi:glycosyltransferase involved in cell wall biosynthesis|nr:MAG: Glycosyltransferase, family 1 [Thermococcales archaeon 44_46]HIH71972.1 glycosyltransferase family 4 protein [Thermococcaceae archaeon]